ncbi:MAG TPA: CdaR family protein [Spirochaetia bacterium]|nr:CdaR family protein [Spirochaetia bacterium]
MKSSSLLQRLMQNWPVKILAVAAAVLLFFFNQLSRLEVRYFSVPLQLVLPSGYVPGAAYPSKVRVTLRGESDAIFRVLEEDVEAYADFSSHDGEGVFKEPIQIRKKGTALNIDPLEITVEPLDVAITLERRMSKSIEIVPSLKGFPPPGYQLAKYSLKPSTVEVVGPRSHLEKIQSVHTEDIDLTGRVEDFTVQVRLVLSDPLLRLPGGNVVEFRGIIQESVVLQTFDQVNVVVVNLEPGLTIAGELPTGTLRVQGKQVDLEAIKPDQVRLAVDAAGIHRPGTYTLPVRPDLPTGILVLRYDPARITLEAVRSKAEIQ